MATKKVLVEIQVKQTGQGLPKVTTSVDKLAKATERLTHEQTNEAKELTLVNTRISQQVKANKKLAASQIQVENARDWISFYWGYRVAYCFAGSTSSMASG